MKKIHIYITLLLMLMFIGCEDFLNRPPKTNTNDETAWETEENVRLYANKYYTTFFPGYGSGYTSALMGYTFSDDVLNRGNQSNFTRSVPNSGIWGMSTIRSINIMIDRLETRIENILDDEAYRHWMGVGRFYRAFNYANLVRTYGDVPYYEHVVKDTDKDDLYKPRTPRNEVMDSVYKDLKYAIENVRENDGDQNLNKDIVAGVTSRLALFEGTWQKYYYENNEQAVKFLQLAKDAADLVINSGKYQIDTDYRSLFTSEDLANNQGVIFYRHYDASVGVKHSTATYSNLVESLAQGPTTDLFKSYLCTDGQPWQNSSVDNPDDFSMSNLIKTRDSRLEATFHRNPEILNRASFIYVTKFLPRDVEAMVEAGQSPPAEFQSNNNTTDYPVLRYAEVLLNWIEAKAELATLGEGAVNQGDLNQSINEIRDRPLAEEAIARGVEKTAPLKLANLPDDPSRHPDVSPLIWEIRRERRMEFTFEYSRYEDLKRWHKLENMDTDKHGDLLSGGWVNFPEEMPDQLTPSNAGKISVMKLDGEFIEYNGTNDSEMRGFFRDTENKGRRPFIDISNVNPYLSPVGKTQMDDYESHGYTLEQTEGWPEY